MCICMIFTLLPFSALADATAQDDGIVYGMYDNTGWNEDKTLTAENSVKHYPASGETSDNKANIDYSKTAVKNDDGSYNVTLTIKSTTKETPPGASAVVLVIDNSNSMNFCATCNYNIAGNNIYYGGYHSVNCTKGNHTGGYDYANKVKYSDSRLKAAQDAAIDFAKSYAATGTGRYLAIVTFHKDASIVKLDKNNVWLDVSNSDNLSKVEKAINGIKTGSGTNLSEGLNKALNALNNNTVSEISSNNKYTVLLTDGEPNYPNNPATAAKSSATNLKEKCKLYTVCVGAENTSFNGTTVGLFLKNSIASDPSYAYNTDSTEKLNKAFKDIFKSIEQGISSGFTVTDPMGKYVELQDTSLTDSTISSNGTITWEPKAGTTVNNDDGSKTTTYTLTYKVTLGEVPEDGTYPLNMNTTLKFKDGETDKTLQFNVPGVKGTAPRYTVTYQPGDHGTLDNLGAGEDVVRSDLVKGTATPDAPTVNADEGYYFKGWEPERAATVTGDAVYTAKYDKRNDLNYTVHYYLNGTTQKVEDDKVVDGKTFEEVVTETYATIDGYTFAGTPDEQTKTITIGAGTNEIIFYYYQNVTLTANSSLDNVYDGTQKSVSSFTGAPEGADFSSITVGAQGTDAGTYDAVFDEGTVGTVDATEKYIVVKADSGKLEIARANVTVKAKNYEIAVGSALPTPEADVSGLFGTDTVKYTISGMPANSEASGTHTLTPSGEAIQGNYNVTYETGTLTIYDTYTVTYKYECTDGSSVPETVTAPVDSNSPYRAGSSVTVLNAPTDTIDGYIFDGWYIGTAKMDGKSFDIMSNTVIIGKWKPVTGLTCTINYIWNGKGTLLQSETIDGLTYNETITKSPIDIPGFTPVSKESKELVIKTTGNVINFYYYKNVTLESKSGTFTYDGKDHSVSGYDVITKADNGKDVKVDAEFRGVSASRTEKGVGSYPVMFKFKGEAVDKQSLIDQVDSNEYYIVTAVNEGTLKIEKIMDEVTVNIKGNTKTVTYNGKEQQVEGYAADTNGLPITVKLANRTATAKGTEVGTYNMNLESTDFVATSDIYGNIKIVIVEDGWLKINRRPMPPVNPGIGDEIIVEITGNSDSVVYDGAEHSVKGYTVEISDSRYTEKDFTFSGKDIASGVNAGTYEMGLKADQFKNTNALFKNVKFVIKADGVLTITPMDLTITAGSKDGIAPVTCNEYENTDLAKGDVIESVKITGEQLEPGQSPNVASDAVIKNAKGEDVTKNYNIKYVDGTLKAVEPLNKEDHFNYIVGYTDGTIRPNNNITRAEVAAIFFRLLTDEARSTFMTDDCSFSDVAQGAWCRRSIATLTNAEIISGYTDGTFKPNAPITRAELATIIARFAKLDVNTKTFSDINGHWAQKYIELAAGNGWIDGYTDGTFRPNQNIKRAETFAMINRVLDRVTESNSDLLPTDQMNMWSDNMDFDAWYYRDVQEATNNHKAERVGDSIYEKWTEKLPDIDWAAIQL